MGEPVSILYLAEQMIRLSGKQPNVDIEIIETGLRPGEKLVESLFYDKETVEETGHEKIHRVSTSGLSLGRILDDVESLFVDTRNDSKTNADLNLALIELIDSVWRRDPLPDVIRIASDAP